MACAALQYDYETEGEIVSYDPQKHLGIIQSTQGGKILYYVRTIDKAGISRKQLKPGTKVSCKVATREKGMPKAKQISLLS